MAGCGMTARVFSDSAVPRENENSQLQHRHSNTAATMNSKRRVRRIVVQGCLFLRIVVRDYYFFVVVSCVGCYSGRCCPSSGGNRKVLQEDASRTAAIRPAFGRAKEKLRHESLEGSWELGQPRQRPDQLVSKQVGGVFSIAHSFSFGSLPEL